MEPNASEENDGSTKEERKYGFEDLRTEADMKVAAFHIQRLEERRTATVAAAQETEDYTSLNQLSWEVFNRAEQSIFRSLSEDGEAAKYLRASYNAVEQDTQRLGGLG